MSPLRVYIATRLHLAARARALAAKLTATGYVVTSRWHAEDRDAAYEAGLPRERRRAIAAMNHADIGRAEAFVLLAGGGMQGALVELGLAHGMGRFVVVQGAPADHSLMLDLPGVHWVESETEVRGYLHGLAESRPLWNGLGGVVSAEDAL